jgi:hypothetical protein
MGPSITIITAMIVVEVAGIIGMVETETIVDTNPTAVVNILETTAALAIASEELPRHRLILRVP